MLTKRSPLCRTQFSLDAPISVPGYAGPRFIPGSSFLLNSAVTNDTTFVFLRQPLSDISTFPRFHVSTGNKKQHSRLAATTQSCLRNCSDPSLAVDSANCRKFDGSGIFLPTISSHSTWRHSNEPRMHSPLPSRTNFRNRRSNVPHRGESNRETTVLLRL